MPFRGVLTKYKLKELMNRNADMTFTTVTDMDAAAFQNKSPTKPEHYNIALKTQKMSNYHSNKLH